MRSLRRPSEAGARAPLRRRPGRVFQGSGVATCLAAATLLLVHLLGPLADGHAHDRPAESSSAASVAAQSQGSPRVVSQGVADYLTGPEAHRHGSGSGHTSEAGCGYLLPSSDDDQLKAPLGALVGALVAAAGPPTSAVACSPGERDPPDLVRELHVIRV